MTLQPGKYTTRNSRIVELFDRIERQKQTSPGILKDVVVWKGKLFTPAGALDSIQEWEETNIPNTIATYVSAGRVEGVTSEFDLVYKFPAAA